MKKYFLCFLCITLIMCFPGCQKQSDLEKPVTFYYQTETNAYSPDSSAIRGETREGSGLEGLTEIFLLYLQGPEGDDLTNPFPAGLRLISCEIHEGTLYLSFSDELGALTGLDLTIACCCAALTGLSLTDATNVCISAEHALLGGERSITLSHEEILLLDLVQQANNE